MDHAGTRTGVETVALADPDMGPSDLESASDGDRGIWGSPAGRDNTCGGRTDSFNTGPSGPSGPSVSVSVCTTGPPVTFEGIVLAAGQSTRLGRPKALLAVGRETFLSQAVRVLGEGGAARIIVVVGDAPEVRSAAESADVTVVVNPDPTSEQLVSLLIGLDAVSEDVDAVAVLPVDCPLVATESVKALAEAAARTAKPIVLPMYNGVGGHPVMLRRPFFDVVRRSTAADGLRGLIVDHGHDVEIINVSDPGILVDIDTAREYDRYVDGKA